MEGRVEEGNWVGGRAAWHHASSRFFPLRLAAYVRWDRGSESEICVRSTIYSLFLFA
jgi:hypothetical protein